MKCCVKGFLYHPNKIEGSTFTTEALAFLLDKNVVTGRHTLDDVQETVNSSYVFDAIIDSLKEKITHSFLRNLHSSLMFNTTLEVEPKLDELIEWYYNQNEITTKVIAEFHYRFELIHPFQDSNGRIGRFIMLKQMLENNLPIKIASWDSEDLYRSSLSSCGIGNYDPLIEYISNIKIVNIKLMQYKI
ncbi:cell filamentation protein Fic [Clostridioides difficile]|nr:cell filamentation protein Fic [Clostridioides difficile]